MMKPAVQRRCARSILGFLRWWPEHRGAVVVATIALAMLGAACGGSLKPSHNAPPECANVGWAPAAVCALAFDPGPCRGAIPVYAFVGGNCIEKAYGGCDGNDNRFASFEECMGTCVGQPPPGACPPNRVEREICFACGPAGGCAKKGTVCALVCDSAADASVCEPALPTCYQGVCQVTGCI
jgi:hypothetical protein